MYSHLFSTVFERLASDLMRTHEYGMAFIVDQHALQVGLATSSILLESVLMTGKNCAILFGTTRKMAERPATPGLCGKRRYTRSTIDRKIVGRGS